MEEDKLFKIFGGKLVAADGSTASATIIELNAARDEAVKSA